jgi:phosphotransferase system HPr-like phosphotransfer protein
MIRINVKKASGDNSLIMAVSKFESAVTAVIDGKEYNVKSIMSSVIINSADSLDLVINGPDERHGHTHSAEELEITLGHRGAL